MPFGTVGVKSNTIWPTECRQRGSTYSGTLYSKVEWKMNGVEQKPLEKDMGQVPIMLKVNKMVLMLISIDMYVLICVSGFEL